MNSAIFTLKLPTTTPKPLLLSSPHSGIEIPDDIAKKMTEDGRASLDTDRFVDELYDFGPSLGFTQIAARFSRYVIDLNRDPKGQPLYSDGRHTTALVPVSTFEQKPIYLENQPDESEVERRHQTYFAPYHVALSHQLARIKSEFGIALLWDCHSIKRQVPSIRKEPFPDVILGNQDGKTCRPELLGIAREQLEGAGLDVSINTPFKGGFITRNFGRPRDGWHAIQLEMSQDLYMNEGKQERDAAKHDRVQKLLSDTLQAVVKEATR